MRVSTAYTYEAAISSLQKRQTGMTEAQVQLTTGKRVAKSSDDPTAAAQAERARTTVARTVADQRAVNASKNVMSLSDGALGDATELLQQARETMVAAGNATYSDSERKGLATKLHQIRTQLLSIANRPDGAGGYLFGGQGSSAPPFVDSLGAVTFIGHGGHLETGSDEPLPLSVDGQAAWTQAPTGNGTFESRPVTSAGSAWINAGSVLDHAAITGDTYDITFSVVAGVTTFTVSDNATGLPVSAELTDAVYQPGSQIKIPGAGGVAAMAVGISGQPADADVFQIAPSTNSLNIFDMLTQTINTLNTDGLNNGQVMQSVNSGIRDIDNANTRLQNVRSEVGEVLNRIDTVSGRLDTLKLTAQTDQSNAEDLDMTQAISNFRNQQTGYEAALQSYAIVQRLSLFQYIS